MDRIIAFDIGVKRIGIAISDPFGEMALPVETYHRVGFVKDIEYLIKIANEKGAKTIVCGLPVNFDGSRSVQTDITENFIEELKKRTDIEVVTNDERFTTLEARRILLEADVSRKDRKQVIDKIAASYILEDYLNKLHNGTLKRS